jgi:uncharacterized membrane protein
MTPETINIATHVGAGVCGLTAGLVPLFSRKGGARHRLGGKWFVAFACVSLATAVIGDVFFSPQLWLYAVTCAFAYDLIAGLRALQIKRTGPQALDNLLALAALGAAAALMLRADMKSTSGIIVVSTAGFLAAMALYDLTRPFWRNLWLARVRPVDHGVKMTAAYFAMLSAGAGNLLRGLQPFSQIAPSVLGTAVMLGFIAYYLARPGRIVIAPVVDQVAAE